MHVLHSCSNHVKKIVIIKKLALKYNEKFVMMQNFVVLHHPMKNIILDKLQIALLKFGIDWILYPKISRT